MSRKFRVLCMPTAESNEPGAAGACCNVRSVAKRSISAVRPSRGDGRAFAQNCANMTWTADRPRPGGRRRGMVSVGELMESRIKIEFPADGRTQPKNRDEVGAVRVRVPPGHENAVNHKKSRSPHLPGWYGACMLGTAPQISQRVAQIAQFMPPPRCTLLPIRSGKAIETGPL